MKMQLSLFLLAGLAPLAWSGDMETMRAMQLGDMKPGTVPAMERAMSPQPELQKLDMCVLTEMKNNKCYFKCQSGALVTEPAVRPDFSTGEPAGPCEPYITRQIKAAPVSLDKYITSSQLEDLLEDPNAEVRKAAVKSAKNDIRSNSTREKVLDIFKNRSERRDIRVEAARALSYVSDYSDVQDEIRGLLRYGGSDPRELRVMAYKALWNVASINSGVQDFLVDAVKYNEKDPAARRAAIWALFYVSNYSGPANVLTNLLKYGNEDEATKVEAIKSLYNGLALQSGIVDLFKGIAKGYGNESKPVRIAALKALSGASNHSSVQSFLEDIVRHENDQELRAAAVAAMSPDMATLRDFFHLPIKLEHGGFLSPIEAE